MRRSAPNVSKLIVVTYPQRRKIALERRPSSESKSCDFLTLHYRSSGRSQMQEQPPHISSLFDCYCRDSSESRPCKLMRSFTIVQIIRTTSFRAKPPLEIVCVNVLGLGTLVVRHNLRDNGCAQDSARRKLCILSTIYTLNGARKYSYHSSSNPQHQTTSGNASKRVNRARQGCRPLVSDESEPRSRVENSTKIRTRASLRRSWHHRQPGSRRNRAHLH